MFVQMDYSDGAPAARTYYKSTHSTCQGAERDTFWSLVRYLLDTGIYAGYTARGQQAMERMLCRGVAQLGRAHGSGP